MGFARLPLAGWIAPVLLALTLAACASTPGARPGAPRLGPDLELSPRPSAEGPPMIAQPPLARAAEANVAGLQLLPVSPFGRAETGWEIYMPLVAAEIGADPVPQGVGFAAALARWQHEHGLAGDGVFTPDTLTRIRNDMQARRPFLRERTAKGPCPDAPDEWSLAWTTEAESWGARTNAARPAVLAAWRRMREAARRDGALESPLSLQVFSGFRSPVYDAGRCAQTGNCDGVRRASCSAHRTGLTLDLVLDGRRPVDSTAQPDRLRLSRSSTYRWMLKNARRFGFVNYPFEPWHWEWTGETIQVAHAPPPPGWVPIAPPGSPASSTPLRFARPELPSAPIPYAPSYATPAYGVPATSTAVREATDLLPPGLSPG